MATNYPGSIDSYTIKVDGTSDVLAADINNLQDAVVALETRVGTTASPTFLPRSGGTMTGALTTTGVTTNAVTISSTAPQINMVDTDQGTTRYLHVNGNSMGFLNTSGGWDFLANNAGQLQTPAYGWLHDYFFSTVANCAPNEVNCNGNTGNCLPEAPINCYGGGNLFTVRTELLDNGSQIQLRSVRYNFNCNCDCNCACVCGW